MTRAVLLALALGCASALHAQEAATLATAPRSLPGVADIDFALRGREVETPGTPTEEPVRPSAALAPAGPVPAPQASQIPYPATDRSSGVASAPVRPPAQEAGAPSPAPDATSLSATDAPFAQTPELDAAPEGVQEQGATGAAAAPSPAIEQYPSGFPA
ncbi:MAG: hypothetical protein FJX31_04220 [Alphaproteobacteria bacterium]|nr:hypothetical protein [Alphaproteobacteria bacterium]